MTADSDDTIPEQIEDDQLERDRPGGEDSDDDSLIDRMRGTGVGVEDPDIVGPSHHPADEQVAEDEPPEV